MTETKDPGQYLHECTTIFPEQIEEEFVRTPADIAYWNAQFADALDVYLRAKAAAKKEWARLWLLMKAQLSADGAKPTEKMIDANVEVHDDWQKAQLVLIDAEVNKAKLQGDVDAVHTKRDMLQSLGAKLRVEMMSDPQVRREQAQIGGRG